MVIAVGFFFIPPEIPAIRARLVFAFYLSRHEHPTTPVEPDSWAAAGTEKPF